jgi:hypothetical protein
MSTNTPIANKVTKQYPFAVIFLAIAFVLSYLIIAPAPTISHSVAGVPVNETSFERGKIAYAARYQGMAKAYAAKEASSTISVQRSRTAEVARLNGVAKAFVAMEAGRFQRSWEADAARYTAMGNQYIVSENIQRGWNTYAARYQAMADQFAAREAANIQRGWDAYAARYTAMGESFMKR